MCLGGFNLVIFLIKTRLNKELKHGYFSFRSFITHLKKIDHFVLGP